MKTNSTEYLLCSAIWFDDGNVYVHQPKNIKTGFIVCGRRHHNCFASMRILSMENDNHLKYEKQQGFLTNTDRFVDRTEAAQIAFDAGQTKEKLDVLYSENVW